MVERVMILSLVLFIILLSVVIWSVKINLSYTLSKEETTLLIRRYNWFTETVREVSLDEIEKVFLEKSNDIDDFTSRIIFKLKTGEDIQLTPWLDSYPGKKQAIKRINYFLK